MWIPRGYHVDTVKSDESDGGRRVSEGVALGVASPAQPDLAGQAGPRAGPRDWNRSGHASDR